MSKDQFKENIDEKVELRAAQITEATQSKLTDGGDGRAEAPEDDPYIGRLIAQRISVLERLGSGGMSTVYKANHQLLDRIVAVKVVQPGNANSQAIRRFQQEAKAATALNHPNIAAVREFGIDEAGNPYLVMDYVSGVSLDQELKQRGALAPERIVALMLNVCDGLEHAHAANIVHRDLKPANIIITHNENGGEAARIVDFGIAKLLNEENATNLTKTGDIFGTPNYMSPEQCMGQKEIDQRTDIYSLGCLMFECLEGKPPFGSDSSFETLLKHVNEPPVFASLKTNSNLKKIILRCMEKDPKKRYQTLAAVKQDLLNIGTGKEIKYKRAKTAAESKRIVSFGIVASLLGISTAIMVAVAITVTPILLKNQKEWNKVALQAQQQAALGPSNYGAAKSLYKKAIRLATEGGASKLELRDIYAALGRVNTQETDADDAVKNFNKALELNGEGVENAESGSYNDWMCDALVQAQRWPEAVLAGKRAVDIKRKVLGPEHQFTLYAMLHLGQAYRGNNMLVEAENIDKQAISLAEKIYPERDNVSLADSYEQLGNLYRLTNRPNEALQWYEKALPVSINLRGDEDKRTLQIKNRLIELHTKLSDKRS